MPLVPDFSATSQIGIPNSVYVTDLSTGTDVLVTARRAYIQDVLGNYLPIGVVDDYTPWALSDTSKSIAALTKDTAAYVRIDWVDAGGVALYTKTKLGSFRLNGLQQSFSLTGDLTSNPALLQDNDWFMSKMKLRVNIDDSLEAVEIGGNQEIAQNALERSTYMIENKAKFF